MENNILHLKTSDGIEISVPVEIINILNVIGPYIQEHSGNSINLESITSNDLNIVLQFCEHHNYTHPPEIIRPLLHNELKKCVQDEWDANFINSFEFDKVTEILITADLLKCTSLVDLCYSYLALYFRGTPIQELKKKFLLTETEFNEAEIKEIKDGNSWLMTLQEDRLKELDNC